jgi:hypothetical protein
MTDSDLFDECDVSAEHPPSDAGLRPVVTQVTEEVGLDRGGRAAVTAGLVQRLPWPAAIIIFGWILTIAWTDALVWLLHLLWATLV